MAAVEGVRGTRTESADNSILWIKEHGLDAHAKKEKHVAWTCSSTGCGQLFITHLERDAHEQTPHTNGHGRFTTPTPFDCVECGESVASKPDLLRHAKEKQHQPYSCECGAFFSRLDVLNRHLMSLGTDDPKYPCKYCRRHRGANGFRRRDHLTQHIRNYHHLEMDDESTGVSASRFELYFPVCTHSDCPQYRDEAFKTLPRSTQKTNKPFPTQSAYTKHMREEHNECAFPCDIQGCDRVGRRGYFREKDMMKHRRGSHLDAPPYQPSERDLKYRCTEPGCGALLDPSSARDHHAMHRYKESNREAALKKPLSSTPQEVVEFIGGSNDLNMAMNFGNQVYFGY
ncbi:RB-associated KRAB zinc finger protein [Lachnellula occidentalis]|uniref:RB-associated KRAB zinc finger protein n=1 Tax=Lachnellula occidentalis TaxID=215460 RepID=A0A8H8UDV5_9HELO|nr:RB-associated KRAB zinc finger protein [Lachnellula occidentalis]